MPTTVTKKIGATNSPTTMDYTSIQAWEDALPANLVTGDTVQRGQCYDQGTFTAAAIIAGETTDATRYVVLECAGGASFKDKAGVRTTALAYNAANGVAVQVTGASGYAVRADVAYTRIDGLQLKVTTYAMTLRVNANNVTVSNCLVTSTGSTGFIARDFGSGTSAVWANCLFVYGFNSGSCITLHGKAYNCTFVNAAAAGTSNCFDLEYNVGVVKNCAVFGFGTFTTGTPAAGSDYNATDKSSAVTGSNNQTSLTYASQFVNSASDWRSVSTGGLKHGTPDSTNAPNDISGNARDATTPYIGCWEATASAPTMSAAPLTIPASHSGNITLTLAGVTTSWVNGTTVFSVSGVSGVTKVSQNVTSNTAATLVVTTGATTGTLTITESVTGSATTTVTVATAALAVSPLSGVVSTTPTLTLTGTNTLWQSETAAGLFSVSGVSGCSIGTPTVTTNTSATAVLTLGSSTGTLTVTDNSTGKTATFTVSAVSGAVTISTPSAYQIYQRDGANLATIPITGTWADGPSGSQQIEASWNGGAYTTIATVTAGFGLSGSYSGSLTGQSAGQGTLTVRFKNLTAATASKSFVGIGDVFLIYGQSNAVGQLLAQNSYANGAGLKAGVFDYFDAAWQDGNDPFISTLTSGSPWPRLFTHVMNKTGYPCGAVQAAIGGKSLDNGTPSPYYLAKRNPRDGTAGTGYTTLTTALTASGVNSFKAVLWIQGENDADGGVLRGPYAASLVKLAENLALDAAGAPKTVVMQRAYSGGGGSTSLDIRLATGDAAKLSTNILGMATDYDFTNALHYASAQDGINVSDRMYAVLEAEALGGTSGSGRGPRMTACQYSADRATVTVSFDKVLKTGLSMAPLLWGVTGNGSAVGVSSVAYHPTDNKSVTLTLASAAATPILVSFGVSMTSAGLVPPKGPDFTLPGGAGTINLPAEPFYQQEAGAGLGNTVTGGGGLLTQRGFTGGYAG